MLRVFRVFCLMFLALAGLAAQPALLSAQEEGGEASSSTPHVENWPAYPLPSPTGIDRGPGNYLSPFKLVLLVLVFFAWVKSCDWVNRDTYAHRFNQSLWNPVMVFPFLAAFFLIGISLPIFLLGFPLLLISYVAPFATYVWIRNEKVQPHQKVFTPDHFRHLLASRVNKAGGKMASEKKTGHKLGAEVEIKPTAGKDNSENQALLILARQSPCFVTVKDLLADAVDRRATKVLLDITMTGMAAQFYIDGVWHKVEGYDHETGEQAMAVLKKLCNLKMEEKRARQDGRFAATYKGQKFVVHLVSQGTKAGERAIVQLSGLDVKITTLTELGMRDKLAEQLKELLAGENGLLLFSAMPGGGLTTTLTVALRSTDRFMRDFIELRDADASEPEVENIEVHRYEAKKGETPDTLLPALLRKEPNAVVVRDLPNAATVKILSEASEEKLVITSVRAKEAVEALMRVLMVKAPAAAFAPAVQAVVCQRLIRRLCEQCKEAYPPPKGLLPKLGIPEGRIEALYRPPTPDADKKQEICQRCSGIGYYGQTAIFELVQVDDKLRQALVKQPTLEVLRKAAKAGGNRTLQEEGILLVAKGVTSLVELQRVLKQ